MYFGAWGTNTPTGRTVVGTLPPGVSFISGTYIQGTPSIVGNYPVIIGASNDCGTSTGQLYISVSCDTCAEVIFSEGGAGILAGGATHSFSYNVSGKFCCSHPFNFEWQRNIGEGDGCGQFVLKANGSTLYDTGCDCCDCSSSTTVVVPAGTTTLTLDVTACGPYGVYYLTNGNCY